MSECEHESFEVYKHSDADFYIDIGGDFSGVTSSDVISEIRDVHGVVRYSVPAAVVSITPVDAANSEDGRIYLSFRITVASITLLELNDYFKFQVFDATGKEHGGEVGVSCQ